MTEPSIRQKLDWGTLAPLRLKARALCEGLFTGGHRSIIRGDGVEFGGHRQYVPGDDLRWLDARAAMRHGRLLVREFEAERQRTVSLLLDASESMGFRSEEAPGAKLAYAALVSAALAYVAVASHDAVALGWFGGDQASPVRRMFGRVAFESVATALESAGAGGSLVNESDALRTTVDRIASLSPGGSVIVVVTDLVDLPEDAPEYFAALTTSRRIVVVVQLLDPVEANFGFDEPARLSAVEGSHIAETAGREDRISYLGKLEAVRQDWRERLMDRGGRLVCATTDEPPIDVVRRILRAAEGRPD
jgi:uncharacterized protein (DUF58 family)